MKQAIPKLRFADFVDGWKTRRLDEIGTVIRGSSPRPQGDRRYYGGNIPRLMVADVTRDGKYVTPRVDFLTEEGARLSRPCKAGTLTIVCSGTVGIPSILAVDACIHDGFLALIDIDEEVSQDYVYHQLTTLRDKFERSATHGGVFTNLTTSGIKEFEIAIPSYPEQQKIAAFLSAIDEKIRHFARKKELLLKYKKAVIQRIFDHKIRFNDENGKDFRQWREDPLREYLVESRVPGSKGDIAKKLTVKLWGKGVHEKDNKLGSSSTQYYKRRAGQLIYSKLDFLNCAFGLIPEALDGYESTVDLPCFDISNALNPQFLLLTVTREKFYLGNGMTADGSRKARRVHADTFLDFPIKVPEIAEQDKIANFVNVLERKIELVDQQLITTKRFKKGLLQQMFV